MAPAPPKIDSDGSTRTTSKAAQRARRLASEIFEALTFGGGMIVTLVGFLYAVEHSTGYVAIASLTVLLLVAGVLAGWQWKRWGPLAGMVLVLVPCWLLVSIVGAPGTLD